jgi:hypothetical protein
LAESAAFSQRVQHSDLTVSRGHARYRRDLTRVFVVAKFRTDEVVLGHDPFERGSNNLLRGRRGDIEIETPPIEVGEELRKQVNVLLEPDAFAGLHQMMLADAAILRIVQQQVGQFAALLYQVSVGKPTNPIGKAVCADEFAERKT